MKQQVSNVTNSTLTNMFPTASMSSMEAYNEISDLLASTNQPHKNLGSFSTFWMEPEAESLIIESMKFNLANVNEYPEITKIVDCVTQMLAELFHAPGLNDVVGVPASGSSEAILLAGLAMKQAWQERQLPGAKPTGKPNVIIGENSHITLKKFARYFDVEPRYLPLKPDSYAVDYDEVLSYIDENTIGIFTILGTTFTGEFEPIDNLNNILEKLAREKGLFIPIHVDAASGGFIAPFLYPAIVWDFRLPHVISINVSGHKYGLVYPGTGWVVWRDQRYIPESLIFDVDYLSGDISSFGLNFTKSASPVIAQYYNIIRYGKAGFTSIVQDLKNIADYLMDEIASINDFQLINKRISVPLVVWTVSETAGYTAEDLSQQLNQLGWIVPVYPLPKNIEHIKVLRIVIRKGFDMSKARQLIQDIKASIKLLNKNFKTTLNIQTCLSSAVEQTAQGAV